MEFSNPGLLNELPALKKSLDSKKPSPEALALIGKVVRPFVLRRTKAEVAKDLPERVEQTLYVELDGEQRAHYDALLRHYQASVKKKLASEPAARATPHVLEALLRLRQVACHPGLLDSDRRGESSAKLDVLLSRLRALAEEGHKVLVFSQFTSLLAIVRRQLEREGLAYAYLDGKTVDRAECVERFQTDASIGVFLISLKAGGVGLNLTAADYVFILDPWWNPAVEAQAIDRAHRIGQTRTVIAYRLLARNTVEERLVELQRQKRDLASTIFDDGSALSGRLTREDLQQLLDLS
jgi:SNF2 family DNA or RNA helicase